MGHSTIEQEHANPTVIKFTNCRILRGSSLESANLWISSETGKILNGQDVFFGDKIGPSKVIDLQGRIVSPGFIETQINGAYGFDFSEDSNNPLEYAKGVATLRKGLVQTGVTSFLPTITSQKADVYKKVLHFLAPTSRQRFASDGAEILGAHCEGPFINPNRNGIHSEDVLLEPKSGLDSLADCYGTENITSGTIKLVTIAPELPGALSAIEALKSHSIISAIGHTTTTHETALASLSAGASTITHLFNAMEPLHHRNPGVFGLLGGAGTKKPFYGIIADGIHLHPTCVNIAWHSHPDGLILVTDAMFATGLPDGIYDWTNGDRIEKCGQLLKLHGSGGKIAGSATMMIECINNFMAWTGASEAEALNAATRTPARMLGIDKQKGCLDASADADLVILDLIQGNDGSRSFAVEQVWKFGRLVHSGAS